MKYDSKKTTPTPKVNALNKKGLLFLTLNVTSAVAMAQGATVDTHSLSAAALTPPPQPHPYPPHPPPHPHPMPPPPTVQGDPYKTELSSGDLLVSRLNQMTYRNGLGILEQKLYLQGASQADTDNAVRFLMISVEVYKDLVTQKIIVAPELIAALAADIKNTPVIGKPLDGATAVKVGNANSSVIFIDPAVHEALGYNGMLVRALHLRLFGQSTVDSVAAAYSEYVETHGHD